MKLFACTFCGQVVFFESVSCVACGHRLAFVPDERRMRAIEVEAGDEAGSGEIYRALGEPETRERYRLCENASKHGVCNWAVPLHEDARLCFACRLNQGTPDIRLDGASAAWSRLEIAKRRVIYSLRELGLPIASSREGEIGLGFVFASDRGEQRVITGHDQGVITVNMAEADEPFRERIRVQLGEPYRTLLGHFRHELGHYYWARLVQPTPWLERFRAIFGDDQVDYAAAMKSHYDIGPPADWSISFISAYASMHPWEDWAESFAHYLHMVDTLDTARSYGLSVQPSPMGSDPLGKTTARTVDFESFEALVRAWIPLTLALNSINRGMGLSDVYPFVLSEPAVAKLRFVHDLVQQAAAARTGRRDRA